MFGLSHSMHLCQDSLCPAKPLRIEAISINKCCNGHPCRKIDDENHITDFSLNLSECLPRNALLQRHSNHRLWSDILFLILVLPLLASALPVNLSLSLVGSSASCSLPRLTNSKFLRNPFNETTKNTTSTIICSNSPSDLRVGIADCIDLFTTMMEDDGARVRSWEPPAFKTYAQGRCKVEWASEQSFVGKFSYDTIATQAMQILHKCQWKAGVQESEGRGGSVDMAEHGGLGWFVGVSGQDADGRTRIPR